MLAKYIFIVDWNIPSFKDYLSIDVSFIFGNKNVDVNEKCISIKSFAMTTHMTTTAFNLL